MIIPHHALSDEALRGVIEEYVTRDGTELTDATTKIVAVRGHLDRGELVVVFDVEAETCNILAPDQVPVPTGEAGGDPDCECDRGDGD